MQVGQRAGEIARELGLRSNGEPADTSQGNSTTATWMNLNFFTQNGSDVSNASRLVANDDVDFQKRQAAVAALDKYQQLDSDNTTDGTSPGHTIVPNALNTALHTALSSPVFDVSRPQSRAERAGSRQESTT